MMKHTADDSSPRRLGPSTLEPARVGGHKGGDEKRPLSASQPKSHRRSVSWRLALLSAAATSLMGGTSAAEPDLSGTYLYVLETKTVTKLPIVKDYEATTRSVSVVNLVHREQRLVGRGRVCSIGVEGSSSVVKTEIPPAFVRALPEVTLRASLESAGGGLTFRQAEQTLVVGAKLANERSEPLPSEPDDPRVIDQDRDGNPGMTVRVRGLVSGEVFVTQRSRSRLEGKSVAGGFRGTVDFAAEQRILGATSPFLKGNRDSSPRKGGSSFWLLKLPEGASCREADARAARLRNP